MKPAPSALVAYLNNARSNPDVPLIMADVFTFTLLSGTILCYTNTDVTFSYNGKTYLANSDQSGRPQVQSRGRARASTSSKSR